MSDITRDWSFGGQLRDHRIKNEMLLSTYALTLGVRPAFISQIEQGRRSPPKTKDGILRMVAPLKLSEGEIDMLMRASFNFHLGVLKKGYE